MSDQTINEHRLRLLGVISMPEGLEPDMAYQLLINGECESKKKKSRHDGTYDFTYEVRIKDLALKDEKGQIKLQSKDTKTYSQKMRSMIYALGYEYDEVMPKIIARLERILEELN